MTALVGVQHKGDKGLFGVGSCSSTQLGHVKQCTSHETTTSSSTFAAAAAVCLQGATSPPKHTPTVEEGRMWRGSQYWLAGAAAAVGAYVVLGGHYVTIQTMQGGEEVEEVEEEDDEE